MNEPCENCTRRRACEFEFGFSQCHKWISWANKSSAEEKAEEPEITQEWAEYLRRRFERVE